MTEIDLPALSAAAAAATPKLVRQQHARGCGAACIAMLAGITYEQAAADFGERDWDKSGLVYYQVDAALMNRGFALCRKYFLDGQHNERQPWPPDPFGPVHLCHVISGGNRHFVVMDAAGGVLDPLQDMPRRLGDYEAVNNVAAVYPAVPPIVITALVERLLKAEQERDELRAEVKLRAMFAGYCRSCALSGESNPRSFEEFIEQPAVKTSPPPPR
jgi:hypothetical protein